MANHAAATVRVSWCLVHAVWCLALGCQRSADTAAQPVAASESNAFLKVSRFLGRACALDEAGLAYCWAQPTTSLVTEREGDAVPRRVPELDKARAFTKSSYFSYFVNEAGQVLVWSQDPHSYLGDISRPKLVPGIANVEQLEGTGDLVYALQADGTLQIWNDSFSSPEPGEPGTVVSTPPEVSARNAAGLAHKFNFHYLGRDGSVYRSLDTPPTAVPGIQGARSVTECSSLACALNDAKRAHCWRGSSRQAPFELAGVFTQLGCAAGGEVYALRDDGSVMVATDSFQPSKLTRIPTLTEVAQLALCDGSLSCPHCVKLRSGILSCWGEGPERKLGDGDWPKGPRFVPLQKERDVTAPRAR